MRTVFVEHPLFARKIAPFLVSRWPGEKIVMMPLMQGYLHRPVYPRGLAYRDFPLIQPIEFKPVPDNWGEGYFNALYIVNPDGSVSRVDQSFDEARKTLEDSSSIAYMGDWDYTGVWGLERIIESLLPDKSVDCEVYQFELEYRDEGYPLVIPNPITRQDPDYLALYQAAVVKRHFEFNFYLNSHAIFGKLYREIFQQPISDHFGRNAILTSIRMSKEGSLPSTLPAYLQAWKGTGRYANSNPYYKGMNSFLSCWNTGHELLNLKITRAIEGSGGGFELTSEGAAFVSRIHKDCYDQDLPFRLGEWMSRPLSEVQPIMDRYILTYFRKQQRFQEA
jgi:hypothetical protein